MCIRDRPLAALYCTLIFVVLPGAIGSFCHSGTVQPHVACAFSITNGLSDVLVISKEYTAGTFCFTFPKSYLSTLNLAKSFTIVFCAIAPADTMNAAAINNLSLI